MWQSYLNGLLIAAGLIMAIGAQNAYVLAQSLRREHHLLVATLCVVCDALLSCRRRLRAGQPAAAEPAAARRCRCGAAFLLWYGTRALLRALRPQGLSEAGAAPARAPGNNLS